MTNFDYRVMTYISKNDNLTMSDVAKNFGKSGKESVLALCKAKLLFWEFDDELCHDDSYRVSITPKGLYEYECFRYDKHLRRREEWLNRLYGFLAGIASAAIVYWLCNYVIS